MAKKPLVIANWKMYVESPQAAKQFVATLKRKSAQYAGVEVWLAPPFTMLPLLKGLKLGGQSVSSLEGAHTGEVSASMLKAAGAHFTLVGHSERRARGESNEDIHAQLARAAEAGLVPVLCVGESVRSNDGAHWSALEEQLSSALRGAQSLASKLIVAYEPLWAIGKSAEHAIVPAELEETVIFIRKTLADVLGRAVALKVPILYGGAVEPENAAALHKEGGASGFLVGHASAHLDSFIEILKACR